jgi:D-3-phosphoglycerate dehydrogenase
MAANQIREYLESGNTINSVNLPNISMPRSAKCRIGIIHANQPAMIARITQTIGENISNMTNSSRGDFAYTLIDLDTPLTDARVDELEGLDGVIRVNVYN